MNTTEIGIIEKLNSNIKATIDTNGKRCKEINIEEAIRQGTIYTGLLCCLETDKVIKIREISNTCIDPDIPIQDLIFVEANCN